MRRLEQTGEHPLLLEQGEDEVGPGHGRSRAQCPLDDHATAVLRDVAHLGPHTTRALTGAAQAEALCLKGVHAVGEGRWGVAHGIPGLPLAQIVLREQDGAGHGAHPPGRSSVTVHPSTSNQERPSFWSRLKKRGAHTSRAASSWCRTSPT